MAVRRPRRSHSDRARTHRRPGLVALGRLLVAAGLLLGVLGALLPSASAVPRLATIDDEVCPSAESLETSETVVCDGSVTVTKEASTLDAPGHLRSRRRMDVHGCDRRPAAGRYRRPRPASDGGDR